MEAIVAVYEDWGIGDGRTQPVTVRADRKHFREITDGAAVLLGRKTLEDFPEGKPLRGRINIVLTRGTDEICGAELVHSTEEALAAAAAQKRCIVIGGASVYRQMFPYIDRVFVTKVGCRPESAVFFPNLDEDEAWNCTEQGPVQEENGIRYSFCVYERRGE